MYVYLGLLTIFLTFLTRQTLNTVRHLPPSHENIPTHTCSYSGFMLWGGAILERGKWGRIGQQGNNRRARENSAYVIQHITIYMLNNLHFSLGIYWAYYWDLLGILLGYTGHIIGIYWAYYWDLLGILLGSTGHIIGIYWAYYWDPLGILLGSTGHSC